MRGEKKGPPSSGPGKRYGTTATLLASDPKIKTADEIQQTLSQSGLSLAIGHSEPRRRPRCLHTKQTVPTAKDENARMLSRSALSSAYNRFLSGAHRESTRRIGEELWRLLQNGAAVVNISELTRRSGYSRPTIYRALAFFKQFGKVLAVEGYHTGQEHPGRPIKYRLNPTYTVKEEQPTNSEEKGVSSKRVNPSRTPQKSLKQDLPRPLTDPVDLKTTDEKKRLTRWLAQADVERPPTDREKRKLSLVIRLLVPPVAADPLLDGLWWRTRAPLRLWRNVLGAVWFGVSAFDASEEELTWAVRHGLKRLNEDGNRKAFLDALENEPLEAKKRRAERRLTGLSQWRIVQGEGCTGEALSWFVEIRRSLEKEQEALSWSRT